MAAAAAGEDDADPFEITDYSVASPWERLVDHVETALRAWSGPDALHCPLRYDGVLQTPLLLRAHCAVPPRAVASPVFRRWADGPPNDGATVRDQLMDPRLDFCSPRLVHDLTRWFGVWRFAVLSPVEEERQASPSQARAMLSALVAAADAAEASNDKSDIANHMAFFVPVGAREGRGYTGYARLGAACVRFDVDVRYYVPRAVSSLRDLMRLLADRAAPGAHVPVPPISVTACFTHARDGWPEDDPIEELELVERWPARVAPNLDAWDALDRSMEPALAYAPMLWVRAYLRPPERIARTAHLVRCALGLAVDASPYESMLDVSREALEGPAAAIASAAARKAADAAAAAAEAAIDAVFANAVTRDEDNLLSDAKEGLPGVRAAPQGSLLCRLAVRMLDEGTLEGVAALWSAFVRRVSDQYWDRLEPLPGVPGGAPDPATALLFQKLVLLQWCIAGRRARNEHPTNSTLGVSVRSLLDRMGGASAGTDSLVTTTHGRDDDKGGSGVRDDSSDDWGDWEYADEQQQQQQQQQQQYDNDNDDNNYDGEEAAALSRGKKMEAVEMEHSSETVAQREERATGLTLLATGRAVVEPVTQDHGVFTEDMLEEQQRVLEQLGTSAEAAALRARVQSQSLRSDMAAFKACNVGALLEDFVRWHSPRDWSADPIEEDDEPGEAHGYLSVRMRRADGLWRVLWDETTPQHADQQAPLFHCVREGEKALVWLRNVVPAQLLLQLVACALSEWHAEQRARWPVDDDGPVSAALQRVADTVARVWQGEIDADGVRELHEALRAAEALVAADRSLSDKFGARPQLVAALLGDAHEAVLDEDDREPVCDSVWGENGDMFSRGSTTTRREWILRTEHSGVPYRMYALVAEDACRVALAAGAPL